MDESAIGEYAEAIRQAGRWPFPPIKVVSQILVDGFHRIEAAKRVFAEPATADELRKSLQNIPCERLTVDVTNDDVPELALLNALEANHTHGLRRSHADKRRSVELAIERWPDKRNRDIARLTGTTHPFVAKVRKADEVETLPPSVAVPPQTQTGLNQVETLPPQSDLELSADEELAETLPPDRMATCPIDRSQPATSPSHPEVETLPPPRLQDYANPAAKKKHKRPKDHWHIAIEALGIAGKRFVECMNANGIEEAIYEAVYQHYLDAGNWLDRLKTEQAKEKQEEGHG